MAPNAAAPTAPTHADTIAASAAPIALHLADCALTWTPRLDGHLLIRTCDQHAAHAIFQGIAAASAALAVPVLEVDAAVGSRGLGVAVGVLSRGSALLGVGGRVGDVAVVVLLAEVLALVRRCPRVLEDLYCLLRRGPGAGVFLCVHDEDGWAAAKKPELRRLFGAALAYGVVPAADHRALWGTSAPPPPSERGYVTSLRETPCATPELPSHLSHGGEIR